MTVETPFRDFLAFWAQAEGRPPDEQLELWDRLYAGRHRELFSYYEQEMGGIDVAAALPRFPAVVDGVEATFEALDVEAAAGEVFALLETPVDVRVIAFVGCFTADAWVDDPQDEPLAYFALEAFTEQRHSPRLTAVHEATHVAHWHARDRGWPDDVTGLALLVEGLAIATTLRLMPEVNVERHFFVDDFKAWEAECDAVWPKTLDGLLATLADRDVRAVRRFFWPDWGRAENDRDVPARIAYLVASRVTELLLERHTLPEIARWPRDRALREVRDALAALR